METLKEKTAKGLLWGGLNSGVQQVVGLAFGIVLGRLLSPSDYGMMAMISIFSLVATALQDSGFRTALTNLKDPRPEDYNSVFWFNIIVATTLYAALFLAAPLIGDYYHTERVVPLCRYAFLSIIIASLGTAQSAYLFKHLKAKQQAAAGALVKGTAEDPVGIELEQLPGACKEIFGVFELEDHRGADALQRIGGMGLGEDQHTAVFGGEGFDIDLSLIRTEAGGLPGAVQELQQQFPGGFVIGAKMVPVDLIGCQFLMAQGDAYFIRGEFLDRHTISRFQLRILVNARERINA